MVLWICLLATFVVETTFELVSPWKVDLGVLDFVCRAWELGPRHPGTTRRYDHPDFRRKQGQSIVPELACCATPEQRCRNLCTTIDHQTCICQSGMYSPALQYLHATSQYESRDCPYSQAIGQHACRMQISLHLRLHQKHIVQAHPLSVLADRVEDDG